MGWMDLVDNKLEKLFNAKPDNEAKVTERRRTGVLTGIDAAIAAHKKGDEKGPRAWYTVKGGVARCTVRSGTKPISLFGKTEYFVPAERVGDFYQQLRADIAKGQHDKDINDAWGERANATRGDTATRAPSSRKGRKLDPEKVFARNVSRYGQARADELRARAAK